MYRSLHHAARKYAATLSRSVRFNSSIPTPKKRPSFYDLLRTPTAKSLFLTTVFGTVVVDMIANRKKLAQLQEDHHTKVFILQDIIERLKTGEKIDLQKELKVAHGAHEANLDIDEKLEEFFKLVDESADSSKAKGEPRFL